MGNGTSEAPASVQSVDRALTILGSWPGSARPASPRSPASSGCTRARRSGWSRRSSPHGMVEQNEERGKYRLGVGRAAARRRDDRPPRRRAGGAADLPQARGRHRGRRSTSRCSRDRSALYLDQVAGQSALQSAQLGRPAHPAARHLQRQGAAVRPVRRRDRQPAAAGCPSYTARDGHHEGQAAPRARARCASRGTPSRSTSSRSG